MNASQLPPAERAFAQALVQARHRAGMSQATLAGRMIEAGFSTFTQNAVFRVECCARRVYIGEAAALARASGITAAEFLEVCGLAVR